MINSLRKGKNNERQLAKMLTTWWQGEFSRTPSSGAWYTQHKQVQLDPARGDLLCPEDFLFIVETKSYNTIDLYSLIRLGTKSEIYGWWEQVMEEIKGTNKLPLLIFKENRKQYYCMLYRRICDLLNINSNGALIFHAEGNDLQIITLESLIKIPKNIILEKIRTNNY